MDTLCDGSDNGISNSTPLADAFPSFDDSLLLSIGDPNTETISVRQSLAGYSCGSGADDGSDKGDGPLSADESERVLEQMRRCVLVHHQLSCLLIHNAALRAGVYNNDGGGRAVGSTAVLGESQEDLEESIHSIGGSTARLFSMALRDRHDLESMESTLRRKVDEMVLGMRSEFDKSNCSAENSPLITTSAFAAMRSFKSVDAARANSMHDASIKADAGMDSEVAALTQECQRYSEQLVAQQQELARLQQELAQVRQSAETFHQDTTVAYFDKAQSAMNRNAELHELLSQLNTIPVNGALAGLITDHSVFDVLGSTYGAVASTVVDSSKCSTRLMQEGSLDLATTASIDTPVVVDSGPEGHADLVSGSSQNVEKSTENSKKPQLSISSTMPEPIVSWRKVASNGPTALASPESLAQLNAQLRTSQSEFWGM